MTHLTEEHLAQAKDFAYKVFELVELDHQVKANTFLHNYQPSFSFDELTEQRFPCAFFQSAGWLDSSGISPALWLGKDVGYGQMLLIPWDAWQYLRPQLEMHHRKLADKMIEQYFASPS